MSNRKKYNKKEHTTLKKAFLHSQIKIFGELANNIFGGIINRISEEKEEKRRNPMAYKKSFEFPFIQGDGLIAGLPDIIYETDDFVLGIEHFQFDAAGKSIKGSKMRLAEIKTKAKLEEKKKILTGCPKYIEENVDVEFSYEEYVKSLLDSFTSHSDKIDKYKATLKNLYPTKKIYFAFFIEDITAIGNYICIKNTTVPMTPLYVREFIDKITTYNGIDFVIASFQNCYIKQLHIQEINNNEIQQLYQNVYNINNDKYYTYKYKKTSHIYSFDDDENID